MGSKADASEWKRFENYVASVYSTLGFIVDTNAQVNGQQVDVIAERSIPGLGKTKVLVECKYREGRAVTNAEVQDFLRMFLHLRISQGFTNGVLVTNTRFTPEAWAVAAASSAAGPIHLRTIAQLEDELLNITDSLNSHVVDFERSEAAQSYVPLRAIGNLPGVAEASCEDVERSILEWIARGNGGYMSIQAGFGAGKTTLLLKIKHALARQKLEKNHPGSPVPLLFALRDFRNYDGLQSYILATLQRELRRDLPIAVFDQLLAKGTFVVLLDGFDEIHARSDAAARRQAFLALSPLITKNPQATILTCRPEVFVSEQEYNKLIDEIESLRPRPLIASTVPEDAGSAASVASYEELSRHVYQKFVPGGDVKRLSAAEAGAYKLCELTEDQVKIVVRAFEPQFRQKLARGADEIMKFLDSVYDLSDLMTRPFLLRMIIETILSGKLDIDDKSRPMNAAVLYEIYTAAQLAIESSPLKGRTLLSTAERQQFAELLAIRMHDAGYGPVPLEDLLETLRVNANVVSTAERSLTEISEEELSTDVRLCSFLSRTSDGEFVFAHRSFMEFFLARAIRFAIETVADGSTILNVPLQPNVIYFLGAWMQLDEKVRIRAQGLMRRADHSTEHGRARRQNLLAAILKSNVELRGSHFSDASVSDLTISRIHVQWLQLLNIVFVNVTWKQIKLIESTWTNVDFSQNRIGIFEADATEISGTANNTKIDSLVCRSCGIALDVKALEVGALEISEGRVRLRGGGYIKRADISGADVQLFPGAAGERLEVRQANVSKSTLRIGWTFGTQPARFVAAVYSQCKLIGFHAEDFVIAVDSPAGPTLAIRSEPGFSTCEGVLFLTEENRHLHGCLSGILWLDQLCVVDPVALSVSLDLRTAFVTGIRGRFSADLSAQIEATVSEYIASRPRI